MNNFQIHLLSLFLLSTTAIGVTAHPSWGLVVDDRGCIYFADVLHNGDGTLWKINPEESSLEAVFTNFHAHNITINQQNEITAGLAIWRSGEIEEEGHNYLLKYYPETGHCDTLLFTDDWDEFHGQTFTMSSSEKELYFSIHGQLYIKPIGGKTQLLLQHKFQHLGTLTLGHEGGLWITDSRKNGGSLYLWNQQNGLVEIANRILPEKPAAPIFKDTRHQLLFGVGFTPDCEPLVTENADRAIWRINEQGEKFKVYQSPLYWSPVGVYYKNGNYYVMEVGYQGGTGHLGPRILILDKNFAICRKFEIDFASQTIKA